MVKLVLFTARCSDFRSETWKMLQSLEIHFFFLVTFFFSHCSGVSCYLLDRLGCGRASVFHVFCDVILIYY